MIITTTELIEGKKIIDYLGPINTNIVIGTGAMSDFFASASDVFGGKSGTYTNKLDNLYSDLIENLKLKATKKEADALVGLRIDFDEISGKGMQMFMANAYATGVKVIDEEYYEEYLKIKKEYSLSNSRNNLEVICKQLKEKFYEQQNRVESELKIESSRQERLLKIESSKQEAVLRMEEQTKHLGTSTRTGTTCDKCGYAELTSFDKACPKCKRKFIEKFDR